MADILFLVENLSKTFPDGTVALKALNIQISEGECLLIAGSNGSGKTLLMRMLVGLGEPSSGKIFFKGKELRSSIQAVRRSVGLVFQDADAQIVGETVAEDIAFGPKNLKLDKEEVQSRVEKALAATGLIDKKDAPPRHLSGGEKRRLAVAGVLAMGCQSLIFDEPFANLDWPGVVQVLQALEKLKAEGKTIIILTHELEKALALADRLVILDKGSIRDDGAPQEVLERGLAAYGIRNPLHCYTKVEDCTWLA
ncbi:ABC transporter ATP-binding protein [Treponema sp.]